MKLDFIDLGKLSVSKLNMRHGKKAPDVSDIIAAVRKRGVLVPILVRPAADPADTGAAADDGNPAAFEIVAGRRRFHAAQIVAGERREAGQDIEPMPCVILDAGDDAAAIEASLIENVARLDPDEVTRWETFTRLVKEGQDPDDIAATFALPTLAVKRVLALGNLLPRIRDLYRREKIDAAAVRHLTLASKRQQRDWLALFDDPDARCPLGSQLKAWLLGGQSIPVRHALFDVSETNGIVSDLFGEDAYFADAGAFWTLQDAAIEERRAALLAEGWTDVVIVPRGTYFHSWEHEKAGKRKGGRVYIDVRDSGEVTVHEGYVTRSEARRIEKGEAPDTSEKPARAEVTSTLATYVDLHRHAAVRAAMMGRPEVALRLMVAHAIAGSPLWSLRAEAQATKSDAVRESVENSLAEADFDASRRVVLSLLDFSPEEPRVTGGNGDPYGLVGLFLHLLTLSDAEVLAVIGVVMGETLMAGSAAVEVLGQEIGVDMARYWQADDAFFDLLRDREVLGVMVGDVAGKLVAEANAGEKGKTLKQIVRNHLGGVDGRTKVEGWVPRWMAFPPSGYTARGGIGCPPHHELVMAAREAQQDARAARDGKAEGEVEGKTGTAAEAETDTGNLPSGQPLPIDPAAATDRADTALGLAQDDEEAGAGEGDPPAMAA